MIKNSDRLSSSEVKLLKIFKHSSNAIVPSF